MSVLLIFKTKDVLKPEFFKKTFEPGMHSSFIWVTLEP